MLLLTSDLFWKPRPKTRIFLYVNANQTCEFGSRLMCTQWNVSRMNRSRDFLYSFISLIWMGALLFHRTHHFHLFAIPIRYSIFFWHFLRWKRWPRKCTRSKSFGNFVYDQNNNCFSSLPRFISFQFELVYTVFKMIFHLIPNQFKLQLWSHYENSSIYHR